MSVVVLPSGPPTGSIMLHAGAATNPAPDGWLWCDGAEYHTSDYPTLAAACNGMYGTASAGMFRVPNMSGRVAIGSGHDGTATRNPGETPGAATHTLTATEMPSHDHHISLWDGGHGHRYHHSGGPDSLGGGDSGMYNPNVYGTNSHHDSVIASSGANVRVLTDGKWDYSRSVGGSGAHNNIQPSAVVGGYIIKT